MNANLKRREAILFLISVIVLAFIVGIISNIVFSALYETNKALLTFVSLGVLVFFTVIIYLYLLGSEEKGNVSANFPFVFCGKGKKFIQIPFSSPSVHARYLFDRLSEEKRSELVSLDEGDKFFNSEFQKFIDWVVQETLYSIVINSSFRDKQGCKY